MELRRDAVTNHSLHVLFRGGGINVYFVLLCRQWAL